MSQIDELKNEVAQLRAENEALRRGSLDGYQAFAMQTSAFGPVGHPAVPHFMTCFEAIGVVAERAKKAFRDHKGSFSRGDLDAIFDAIEVVKDRGSFAHWEATLNKQALDGESLVYPVFGLIGESGEVAGKVLAYISKAEQDRTGEDRLELAKECSDVLWYIAALSHTLGYRLSDIAEINVAKLTSRRERGVIHGNGDNR